MIDPDTIYEEIEMNNESDARDQNTDSETEMQEVIVGEEVIEQNLGEVVLYDNAFEGRPVRRRPTVVRKDFVSTLKPLTTTVHRVTRPSVGARQSKTSPVQRPSPSPKLQTPQTVSSSAMSLKMKMENSPLIVKLEGIKRTKPGNSPIPFRPAITPQRALRMMKHVDIQTEITGEIMDQYQQIIEEDQQKINILEDQVRKLKYTPEMFENDDKRTQYFTGLETFVNMVTLFNSCEPELPASNSVSKFEIFMLTLLRLRLKLPLTFLGYMFGVSPKAAHYFYNEGITVIHTVMRDIFSDSLEATK